MTNYLLVKPTQGLIYQSTEEQNCCFYYFSIRESVFHYGIQQWFINWVKHTFITHKHIYAHLYTKIISTHFNTVVISNRKNMRVPVHMHYQI